jgi:CBS domain-containing protein
VSVLYHALHGAENCDRYALDAEASGDARLAGFFREAQAMQVGLAERAKELLNLGGVAPSGPAEVGAEVPPERMTSEVPPGTVEEETVETLLVREVMTPEVVTIEPQASITQAAQRMIDQEKGPLPIVEGDRPVGMVTDRDIIARVVAQGRDPNSVTVDDVATRELVTVGPDQDIDEVIGLMANHQLDRILVVDGERLVGIISEADIRVDEGPLP